MLRRNLGLLLCSLIPAIAISSPAVQCKSYSFLKPEFNFDRYQNCNAHIKQCPTTGPVLDQKCVKRISKQDRVCRQLKDLSNAINASIDAVTAENNGRLTLIDQYFAADGQHNYYIISPQGCLVNTKIDPRVLNASLKKQYKNTPLFIINWNKPIFQTASNGLQSYTALLKVTKNCLACEVIGWATVKFEFTSTGKLEKTSLVSFSKEKPTTA